MTYSDLMDIDIDTLLQPPQKKLKTQRQEQNRANQKAFRQRREERFKELQDTELVYIDLQHSFTALQTDYSALQSNYNDLHRNYSDLKTHSTLQHNYLSNNSHHETAQLKVDVDSLRTDNERLMLERDGMIQIMDRLRSDNVLLKDQMKRSKENLHTQSHMQGVKGMNGNTGNTNTNKGYVGNKGFFLKAPGNPISGELVSQVPLPARKTFADSYTDSFTYTDDLSHIPT